MTPDIFELIKNYGVVGLLFAWFIYLYFKDIKNNKMSAMKNVTRDDIFNEMVKELKLQNENHLDHIQNGIIDGFKNMNDCQNSGTKEIVSAINAMHLDVIRELKNKK